MKKPDPQMNKTKLLNYKGGKTMKISIYLNAVNGEQDFQIQLEGCIDYVERHGHDIVQIYIENAKADADGSRPAFERMIKDSKRKCFEAVLVHSPNCFAHDRCEYITHKVRLRSYGVQLLTAQESPPNNPCDAMYECIMENVAEYYREEFSRRVKRGIRLSRARKAAEQAALKEKAA